ncbi:MAG: GNAT family N-acetyltransferase, partial [Pseudomonadota bacterium]
ISSEPASLHDIPAMFRPLQELENLAPATWYINVLAVVPGARGQGHGRRLLAYADELARSSNVCATSLIVADRNAGARQLYETAGYTVRADRAIVKEDWVSESENWILMTRDLDG